MSNQPQFVFKHGDSLLRTPKAITAFVAKMTAGITPKTVISERRSEPRYTISAIVEAQPVDDEFRPTDDVFKAVTRDISAGGIALTHNRSVETKCLAVQLTTPEGDQIQTVVEVLRCRSHGNTWDIGGRFITKE
jgi:hypothetical protein